jgi:hypothetical protein
MDKYMAIFAYYVCIFLILCSACIGMYGVQEVDKTESVTNCDVTGLLKLQALLICTTEGSSVRGHVI